MHKIYIPLVLSVFLLSSCKKNDVQITSNKTVHTFERLIGDWATSPREGSRSFQKWVKENTYKFSGYQAQLTFSDTIKTYNFEIEDKENESLLTLTNVKKSTEKLIYSLTQKNETELIFENSSIKYPSKITYMRVSGTILYSKLEGQDGKEQELVMYHQ